MDNDSLINTTGTSSSSAYSGTSSRKTSRKKLSVEQNSKIDKTLHENVTYHHRPSIQVVIIKWLSTILLALILLGCVTESKLSVVVLSHSMNKEASDNLNMSCRLFVMLQILLLVPNGINFIRGIWAGGFRKDIPWPKKSSLILSVFVSLLESLGLALFVFVVPGLVEKPELTILSMSSVFILPIVLNIKTNLSTPGIRAWWKISVILAFILELAGIAILVYFNIKDKVETKIAILPVAVLCLSVAWLPKVQQFLLRTKETEVGNSDIETDSQDDVNGSYIRTGTVSINPNGSENGFQREVSGASNMPGTSQQEQRHQTSKQQELRSTWKLTIFMSFFKMLFTFGISLLIFNVTELNAFQNPGDYNMTNYADGWKWTKIPQQEIYYFVSNLIMGIVGYLCGYMACTACMQRLAFVLPLLLSTPLSVLLLHFDKTCNWLLITRNNENPCKDFDWSTLDTTLLFVAMATLVLAEAFTSVWLVYNNHNVVMLKEDQLFLVPMYNSPMLEQWFFLVRKNDDIRELDVDTVKKAKQSRVIICTTMYREADYEMKQLLESIQSINVAQSEGGRHFESHIFFDGAVKEKHPTEFVLQLVSLVESTFSVNARECTKTTTPYGMTLAWKLKAGPGKTGMTFKIHLKDNFKVKNKKRWSQVMYMSYVLDFLLHHMDGATDEETYILTTDADVRFTPDSVEALLDLMTRDHSVGAVCARTHPLGTGPLVWYQVFEYAIGHWFQKAAEHVLGSVLCSPGCFSVYRCKAIRDIIPQYASNVEHAFQFLTKDMGEDRWFCTLMVQSGWRIEYCAASENSTHCPEDFDEFFKQRRRWVASTLANMMLLIKEWNIIAKLNYRVSYIFLIYQSILLFATLIGPSSVILVISGGLEYAWKTGGTSSLVIQLIVCTIFTFVCLSTSSTTQLNVAKFLTFGYAVVMTAVVVGTAVQIATDFNGAEASEANFISDKIQVSTTTVYIGTMAAIFLVTGILHLREFLYLLHGVWYLLCLPAGYLILMIYSICNITDRSWGTREVKTHSVLANKKSWQDTVTNFFKSIFFCCFTQPSETKNVSVQTDSFKVRTSRATSLSEPGGDNTGVMYDVSSVVSEESLRSLGVDVQLPVITEEETSRTYSASVYAKNDCDDDDSAVDGDTVIDVKDWLPADMKSFAPNFIENGFDNTMLISGMTEKELKDIGIKRKGMKKYLMEEIKKLPDYEIQAEVPENVEQWLDIIGLKQYIKNFYKEQIKTPKDMEVLKSFGRTEIEKELKITKSGHIKRLMYAIRRLRNPTANELKIMEVKRSLMVPKTHKLVEINPAENEFWEYLRNICLLPQSTAFGLEDDLKDKLGGLRNSWLMIFAISNALWMILIFTLADQGKILAVFGSNPIGFVVLVLFGMVLIIQFIAMIVHRITTLTHFLGRAPFKTGAKYNTTWAFKDSDLRTATDDNDAERARIYAVGRAQIKLQKKLPQRREKSETTPLLAASTSTV
ncbi:hypothetical protein ACF0H5_024446 [Mactra antiquata]